jgi:hypothetical protein
MSQLCLSIKQIYFDAILSGEKKIETREIKPKNAEKYCDFSEDGELIGARHYDTLKLLTGAYSGVRPFMIIEVEKAEVIIYEDDEGKEIVYEEDGEQYVAADVEYTLGKIIETSIAK